MSFSYCCRESGEEYAVNHSRAFGHMLRRPSEKSTPHTLLGEALSFGRNAKRDLLTGELGEQTLSEYLDERKIGVALRNKYILPMGAALWSAPPGQILTFPAEPYLRFLDNHGLLAISEGLSWSHVAGGSRSYVAALLRRLCNATLRSCTAVDQVLRVDDGVIVHTRTGGAERYDGVILATHADQALHLLGDADALESKLLRAIRYQSNDAVLHWDQSVMPNDPANWASWNYERESIAEPERVCVTYLLNRLQGHSNCERSYFLTLNRSAPIDERKIILRTRFTHPVFNLAAIQAQSVLSQHRVNGRVGLAGSYFGYGFHEDAMASGIAAAESMLTAQAMLEA
jgi:predicted NAD/FAD-binding protein